MFFWCKEHMKAKVPRTCKDHKVRPVVLNDGQRHHLKTLMQNEKCGPLGPNIMGFKVVTSEH